MPLTSAGRQMPSDWRHDKTCRHSITFWNQAIWIQSPGSCDIRKSDLYSGGMRVRAVTDPQIFRHDFFINGCFKHNMPFSKIQMLCIQKNELEGEWDTDFHAFQDNEVWSGMIMLVTVSRIWAQQKVQPTDLHGFSRMKDRLANRFGHEYGTLAFPTMRLINVQSKKGLWNERLCDCQGASDWSRAV